MEDELLDWEMLHVSDKESTDSVTTEMKSASSSVIDDGMLLSYHFSAENLIKRSPEITYDTQYSVMKPGHSSRVDYGSESVEVPVDLGFDQLNSKQLGEDCVSEESGFCDLETGTYGDGEVKQSDFQAVDEKHVESEADDRHVESQSGVEEPIEDSSKSWSDDSREKEMVSGDSEVVNGDEEIVSETEGSGGNTVEVVAVDSSAVSSGDESSKSRETVWWKLPYVVFKYCAFRMSPVWSVSMAAAVMGLILLGRRLYNMKKKSQRFHLKVTIDDKKAARVMSQAARLNEVFTEVRRVPVIRPALPSPGVWPVLNLR